MAVSSRLLHAKLKVVGDEKSKIMLHGLDLQIVEYWREISWASLCQISETFTVSFMGYRPANVRFFWKKSTFYDILRKNTTTVLLKIGNYDL